MIPVLSSFYSDSTGLPPYTVANQAAMLALYAQPGEIAVRSDLGGASFQLRSLPANVLANWIQIS